jgi:hypothetical protein
MIHLLKDVMPIIENTAPIIYNAISSPISGIIINLIAKAFNANPGDISDIVEKINSHEDAPGIFQQLEAKHMPWIMTALSMAKPSSLKLCLEVNWASV